MTQMSRDSREHLFGLDGEQVAAYVASLSPDERDIFRRVELGMDIEAWLKTNPVGQYIAHMVEAERDDASEALIKSMSDEPEDSALHRKHHRRIELCDLVRGWFVDAIETGKQAQQELQAREHEG